MHSRIQKFNTLRVTEYYGIIQPHSHFVDRNTDIQLQTSTKCYNYDMSCNLKIVVHVSSMCIQKPFSLFRLTEESTGFYEIENFSVFDLYFFKKTCTFFACMQYTLTCIAVSRT